MDNRRLIERWKNENMSNRKIAGLLGKAPQTINNEVNRGTTLQQVRKGLYKKVMAFFNLRIIDIYGIEITNIISKKRMTIIRKE